METKARGYIVAPEQGPVWEMEPGRPTTFKLLSEQTGDSVAVFEEVVPVGSGTPLHIHHTSNEVIYILAGEFTFEIGEQVATGSTGTCVFIPRGSEFPPVSWTPEIAYTRQHEVQPCQHETAMPGSSKLRRSSW